MERLPTVGLHDGLWGHFINCIGSLRIYTYLGSWELAYSPHSSSEQLATLPMMGLPSEKHCPVAAAMLPASPSCTCQYGCDGYSLYFLMYCSIVPDSDQASSNQRGHAQPQTHQSGHQCLQVEGGGSIIVTFNTITPHMTTTTKYYYTRHTYTQEIAPCEIKHDYSYSCKTTPLMWTTCQVRK